MALCQKLQLVLEIIPNELQVQVLNGSGIMETAGRLSVMLRDAVHDVLTADNAFGWFVSSVASAYWDEAEVVAGLTVSGEIAHGGRCLESKLTVGFRVKNSHLF